MKVAVGVDDLFVNRLFALIARVFDQARWEYDYKKRALPNYLITGVFE